MDYKELNDLIVSKKSFKINNINFEIKDKNFFINGLNVKESIFTAYAIIEVNKL